MDRLLCGLTPAVSQDAKAVLYVEVNGKPMRGGGAPFSFVNAISSMANMAACYAPDGFCSVRGSAKDVGAYTVDLPAFN